MRVTIDVDEELRSILSPTNVQINSLLRLEAELLEPFQEHSKKLLLITEEKKIIQATLGSIYATHFIANTYETDSLRKHRKRYQDRAVPAIFPVSPQRHYVLQTLVEEIYPTGVKLRYQDPRYDVRRRFQVTSPIALRLAPPATVAVIRQKQVRIVREMTWSAGKMLEVGHTADLLYQKHSAALSPSMQLLEETPALFCGLRDISPGGVCLTIAEVERPGELTDSLALIQILLPEVLTNTAEPMSGAFSLKLLGVIRAVRTTPQPWTVHLRFLKRLPEDFALLFEELERELSQEKR